MYIIRNRYIFKYNGRTVVSQVFRADEMKMYQHMPAIPGVLIWDDYRRVSDTLVTYRLEPDYDWFMEDSLDLLTIESKQGVNHYLLSDNYRIDPQLYREHNFGLTNEQLRVAGGRLPLQLVLNYPDYRVMLSAVSVQKQALSDELFQVTLPADLVPADDLLEKKPGALNGYPAFNRHLQRTMNYPREARRRGTEGRVFFAFVTNEQGRIIHLGKLKGIGSGCDEEAERAIRTFPGTWEPGMMNSHPVKTLFILPVWFRLK